MTKISALAAVTSVLTTDEIVLARSGDNKRINVTDAGLWTTVVKTADESLNTNTTPQNDDHLFFATVAGGVYEFAGAIIYVSPVGTTTPDLKTVWGEDATIRGFVSAVGVSNSDANFTGFAQTNQTATLILGTLGTNRHAVFTGVHEGNGATFRLMWAQNVSNGNDVTVKAGSFIRYRKVV